MNGNPNRTPETPLDGETLSGADDGELVAPTLGRRWLASFIDNIIIGIPMVVLLVAATALAAELEGSEDLVGMIVGLGSQVGIVAAQVLYGALFESSGWHATPGKKLMGLVVVDEQGGWISAQRSLGRSASKCLGLFFCGLLAASVLFDTPRQRGVWDRMAGTRVIVRPFRGEG